MWRFIVSSSGSTFHIRNTVRCDFTRDFILADFTYRLLSDTFFRDWRDEFCRGVDSTVSSKVPQAVLVKLRFTAACLYDFGSGVVKAV
jgi:hypothetical protein